MKKLRLWLIGLGVVVIAPLVGQIIFTFYMFVVSAFAHPETLTLEHAALYFNPIQMMHLLITAYFFGILPALFVAIYSVRTIQRSKPYRIKLVFNIVLILTALPCVPMLLSHPLWGNVHILVSLLIVASLTLYLSLIVGRKLLNHADIKFVVSSNKEPG